MRNNMYVYKRNWKVEKFYNVTYYSCICEVKNQSAQIGQIMDMLFNTMKAHSTKTSFWVLRNECLVQWFGPSSWACRCPPGSLPSALMWYGEKSTLALYSHLPGFYFVFLHVNDHSIPISQSPQIIRWKRPKKFLSLANRISFPI